MLGTQGPAPRAPLPSAPVAPLRLCIHPCPLHRSRLLLQADATREELVADGTALNPLSHTGAARAALPFNLHSTGLFEAQWAITVS